MKLTIHRGTREIGGSCVEIEAEGKRIVIDIGMPLVNPDGAPFEYDEKVESPQELVEAGILPPIKRFYKGEESGVEALIISHIHQDHYGFARYVNPDIPVLIGEAGNNILKAAGFFIRSAIAFKNTIPLEDRQPITIGPFEITPFLVDHSAYDAYSLLVSSGGKRLFYSGDFRAHGRKAPLFYKLIRKPPENVDILLMEGSTLGRKNSKEGFPTEEELVQKYIERINAAKGLCLVWTSSQNIDRITTIFKATRKSGRQLIIDLYTAEMLRATGNPKLPQGNWEGIKVFIPYYMRIKIKNEGNFNLLEPYKSHRIYPEALPQEAPQSVMIFRPSLRKDLEFADCLRDASLIYSLWDGYLKSDREQPMLDWLQRKNIPITKIHTSGHASIPDLQRLASGINPKILIPIHTFDRNSYAEYFDNVRILDDREVLEI